MDIYLEYNRSINKPEWYYNILIIIIIYTENNLPIITLLNPDFIINITDINLIIKYYANNPI